MCLTHSLTYLLTYSKEQSSSWEANQFSANHEIPRILWNMEVHGCVTHGLPPVPILSHLDPVYTTISHFLKIHLNIIVPSSPRSSKWSLFLNFLHPNPVYAFSLPHTCYIPHPSHSQFYHLNNIRWRVQIIKLLIMLFSPLPCYLIHLSPNILLNTLSLRSFLNVSDQVSHPCKIRGKIVVLYILIFRFLDCKLEDKRFCTEW